MNIPAMRLVSHQLFSPDPHTPNDVVSWMGAMQAQDYGMAKLAAALRTKGGTTGAVEKAFAKGEILRTHVMRPTWHFVSPADIRWMLELTGPRIMAQTRSRDIMLGLDEKTFDKSAAILAEALKNGNHLTREELARLLEDGGIHTDTHRAAHLLMRAELTALVCSGSPHEKKQTYALLAERAPGAKRYDRKTSIIMLARRYFTSHGPAALSDFMWWSGLTAGDAKQAADMLGDEFASAEIRGQTCFFPPALGEQKPPPNLIHLLPAFDEYIISYRSRADVITDEHHGRAISGNGVFRPVIVRGGKVIGTWSRNQAKKTLTPAFFEEPGKAVIRAAEEAISRVSRIL